MCFCKGASYASAVETRELLSKRLGRCRGTNVQRYVCSCSTSLSTRLGEIFNNSANTDTEDNWVANSYTILKGGEQIVGITLPIGGQTTDVFTNQPISALIYQGFDINDPTANGGLVLMQETDTTFSTTGPSVVTITLDTPVTFSVGDIMYAAVLIPAVPATIFPFNLDVGTGSGLGGLLQTQPLEQSFFDVGLTFGGPYNVNQGMPILPCWVAPIPSLALPKTRATWLSG